MKKLSNAIIRKLHPCYDPSAVTESETEELPIREWVEKYRDKVKSKQDIFWLLCRNNFLSDKDLRLFAVWCAREALKLIANPDVRSVEACNVAERYANGEATQEELSAAGAAAWAAAGAARDAAWDAARAAQIDQLLTYF